MPEKSCTTSAKIRQAPAEAERARLIEELTLKTAAMPEFWTIEEAAEFLRISTRSLYRLIEQGALRALKPSLKLIRLMKSDVIQHAANSLIPAL